MCIMWRMDTNHRVIKTQRSSGAEHLNNNPQSLSVSGHSSRRSDRQPRSTFYCSALGMRGPQSPGSERSSGGLTDTFKSEQVVSIACAPSVSVFRFLLFVEFPSETKEGFPLRADRQWQHQPKPSRVPYQTHNLTKYKLTICRLTRHGNHFWEILPRASPSAASLHANFSLFKNLDANINILFQFFFILPLRKQWLEEKRVREKFRVQAFSLRNKGVYVKTLTSLIPLHKIVLAVQDEEIPGVGICSTHSAHMNGTQPTDTLKLDSVSLHIYLATIIAQKCAMLEKETEPESIKDKRFSGHGRMDRRVSWTQCSASQVHKWTPVHIVQECAVLSVCMWKQSDWEVGGPSCHTINSLFPRSTPNVPVVGSVTAHWETSWLLLSKRSKVTGCS